MLQRHSACLLVVSLLVFPALSARADNKDAVELTNRKDSSIWKTRLDGWVYAEAISLNDKNPKQLSFKGEGSILVNGEKGRARDLVTKQSFTDVELHAEFLIPKGSNSGIKFHAVYEIQIIDSYGSKKKLTGDTCGGIYPRAETKPNYHHIDEGIAPKVNACKAPGEWQTLDVTFLSPRFDQDGKKIANAKVVKATLNGQLIHENQDLLTPTGNNWSKKEVEQGPILLQGDHGPVAFRNVRVTELKRK